MMNFGGGGVGWSMMVVWPLMMLFGLVVVVLIARAFFYGGTSRNLRDRRDEMRTNPETIVKKRDPLEVVRERYARGEIDHEELEQYLSNLLRSERPGYLGRKDN